MPLARISPGIPLPLPRPRRLGGPQSLSAARSSDRTATTINDTETKTYDAGAPTLNPTPAFAAGPQAERRITTM
jgi:hypothetical protein